MTPARAVFNTAIWQFTELSAVVIFVFILLESHIRDPLKIDLADLF